MRKDGLYNSWLESLDGRHHDVTKRTFPHNYVAVERVMLFEAGVRDTC